MNIRMEEAITINVTSASFVELDSDRNEADTAMNIIRKTFKLNSY